MHRTTRSPRTPTTRTTALAGAALASVLAVGLLASPASAEVEVVTDPAGDGSPGTGAGDVRKWGDIGKVRVKHGPRAVRITVVPAEGGGLADYYDFWVDTDAADAGPEYVASVSHEVLPKAGVATSHAFGDFGQNTCGGDLARREGQTLTLVLPRACFGRPDRLRVATESTMAYGAADWAPRRRTFGPWVDSA